jgi:hypothetical protein
LKAALAKNTTRPSLLLVARQNAQIFLTLKKSN